MQKKVQQKTSVSYKSTQNSKSAAPNSQNNLSVYFRPNTQDTRSIILHKNIAWVPCIDKIDESSCRFLAQETFTTNLAGNKYDTNASWLHSWTIEPCNSGHKHASFLCWIQLCIYIARNMNKKVFHTLNNLYKTKCTCAPPINYGQCSASFETHGTIQMCFDLMAD